MLDLEGLRDLEKWLKEKPAGKSLEADIPTDDPGDGMSRLDVKDLMDLKKQRVKKPAWKNLKAEIPTGDIVHELRLTMDGQKLRIHGIWIGTLKGGDVEHLKNQHKATQSQRGIFAKQEREALEDSYKEHLQKFWYHETWGPVSDFWVYEASSHGSYSRSVHRTDYIRTTATYGLCFVEGGDHDLMKILAELGHKFGNLINGRELVQDLKKLLGVDVFLIFKEKDNFPCLYEIGIFYSYIWELIDYPIATTRLPTGLFKLC